MAVTTRLSWNEERGLQKLLGNVSLRLLSKSSVHEHLFNNCQLQGSTITVVYFSNIIIGVFIPGHYPTATEFSEPISSFCFSFQRHQATEMTTVVLEAEVKIISGELIFCSFDQKMLTIDPGKAKLSMQRSLSSKLKMFYSGNTFCECEVFRVEGMLNEIILHCGSSLSLYLLVIIELQEQGKMRGTVRFHAIKFLFHKL